MTRVTHPNSLKALEQYRGKGRRKATSERHRKGESRDLQLCPECGETLSGNPKCYLCPKGKRGWVDPKGRA